MKGEDFFDSENYIRPLYKSTCPMKTRPMREIMFVSQHPQLISTEIRGTNETAAMAKPKRI